MSTGLHLQPWAKHRIRTLLSETNRTGAGKWIPYRFHARIEVAPRSPLGRKVGNGWEFRLVDGFGVWSLYAGDRLARAIAEEFPEYVDWEAREEEPCNHEASSHPQPNGTTTDPEDGQDP